MKRFPLMFVLFLFLGWLIPLKSPFAAELDTDRIPPETEIEADHPMLNQQVEESDEVEVGELTEQEGSSFQKFRKGLMSQMLGGENLIQQGDYIQFFVYPQEELSATRFVDNEGYVYFPYLGKVQAAGRSTDELGEYLTKTLGQKYLQNPQVFVRKELSFLERSFLVFKDAYSTPVNVVGEVKTPGPFYPLRDDVTVIEAIGDRGSFTSNADLNEVKIIRVIQGREEIIPVKAGDIIQGKAPNIITHRGDVIVVPRFGAPIHVLGEVVRPGPIPVNKFTDAKTTLIGAISEAGGFKRTAATNKVRIVRVVDGKETATRVRAGKILAGKEEDIILEAGDIVVVPEAFW